MQTTVSHILARHTVASEYLPAPPSLASRTTVNSPLKVSKQATNIMAARTNNFTILPLSFDRESSALASYDYKITRTATPFSSAEREKLSDEIFVGPECTVANSCS
jgi:hypothetical protein